MRNVSAAFATAIALGTVKITELYILELADGRTYRFTTHNVPITWDAVDNTYTPTVMERNEVTFTTNFEVGEVGVVLENIGLAISPDIENGILERAILTIKRIRWDANYAADEEFVVFKGFLDIDFNRKILNLSVKSKFTNLTIQIPKFLYEECCNYNLFDNMCGLTRADYTYAGTATAGDRTTMTDATRGVIYKVAFDAGDSANPIEIGDTLDDGAETAKCVNVVYLTATTGFVWYQELSGANFVDDATLDNGAGDEIDVDGTPSADTTFYEQGEIEMTSGPNSGQQRPIALDSAGVITVLWGFVSEIVMGDTYNLYPGCDLRGVTCKHKFHNENTFRGFLYVPRIEDVLI